MSGDLTIARQPKQSDLDAKLRDALRRAMHFSRLSREQIADALNARLGSTISPAQIDAWASDRKQRWRLPANVIPALAEILQDDGIQRHLLNSSQQRALELGESAARLRSLLREILAETKRLGATRKATDPRRKR